MSDLQPLILNCKSPAETERVARRFALALTGGEFVSLEGDLGVGKTFFARAVARALGIKEPITSPTFVLQKIYQSPGGRVGSLIHYDLYRLQSYGELLDLGFAEHPTDSAILAEWGNKFMAEYDRPVIRVRLEPEAEESRLITFSFPPGKGETLSRGFKDALKARESPAQEATNGIY